MLNNLTADERELARLVEFFKKKIHNGEIDPSLTEAYAQMIQTCDSLLEQVYMHAGNRAEVNAEREMLAGMVKDNAVCPKCSSNTMLKITGVETSPQGWKSNTYKCRKCNISFVWNAPNNPWDMIPYVEHFIADLEEKCRDAGEESDFTLQNRSAIEQMKSSLEKLKPVVAASDEHFEVLNAREQEIGEMVKKVKKHLLIEKIRIDD